MDLASAPLAARTELSLAPAPDAALAVVQELLAAFNEHDADAFAALFAPDAWFINVLGHRFSGRAEIAAAHRFLFSTVLAESHATSMDVVSRSLTDDVAVIEAVWDSAEQTMRQGVMVLVLQRGDAREWTIVQCTNGDYARP